VPVREMLFGILFLATSIVVFAQTTETKPLDGGSGEAINSQLSVTPTQNPRGSGAAGEAEVLTDTMGVDFGPYLTRITKIVRQNRYSLMPPRVCPPIMKQGKVAIEFFILRMAK
jgi:hypothetical protein